MMSSDGKVRELAAFGARWSMRRRCRRESVAQEESEAGGSSAGVFRHSSK